MLYNRAIQGWTGGMHDRTGIRSLTEEASSARTTPTGRQSITELRARRWGLGVLIALTYAGLAAVLFNILSWNGWTLADGVVFACFLVASPWSVLGFWNAIVGLWLSVGTRDPLALVLPLADPGDDPLRLRTAVLLTVRNEDPARAFARLEAVRASLERTGLGDRFAYFVLSDTSEPAIAAAEEAAFARWQAAVGASSEVVYRRRPLNTGYKAGNLRDFCLRWGDQFELMLPLDADSLMSGATVVALARLMQANPKLGILQSLVVGLPTNSAFARIFQFGMRHGMRAYTMGSAWWTGECGPFWGHNAMVRIAPFRDHCELPKLPGTPPFGGDILSHDQVEATLMRSAGFEVRVLPVETQSWEENPPTILEFVRRDLRWCLGNMQYVRLLTLPGLLPMSRFQLLWAILMFVGLPAWTVMIALLPLMVMEARGQADFPAASAIALYLAFLVMYLMPKIAGVLDAVLTRGGVARYGGAPRFMAGVVTELVFSFLQGAVSTFRTTLFMIGLAFGRARITWSGQARDAHGLSWTTAASGLWPQFVFGLYVCGTLAILSPTVLLWALPLVGGYLVAIPFAVFTASPAVGGWLARHRLCAIPEEIEPPSILRAIESRPSASQ